MSGPLFVWSPPRARSLGKLAVDLAASMYLKGRPFVMDEHQVAILEDIFAEGDEVGIPAASNVTTIAPRRNLKTGVLIAAALADLFVIEVDRHVWTAHLQRTVRGSFREMRALINSNPDVKGLCKWPPTTGNAQMAIELYGGPMIEFFTRSTGGGRGEGGDVTTLDEGLMLTDDDLDSILPTLANTPHAQARIASSAGLGHSAVLRRFRDRGRAGNAVRTAYWEFGAPFRECESDGCDHIDIDDPGCVLNDRELWAQANPALGSRIRESFLVDMRKDMSPAGFAREFLSWWDEPAEGERAINADAWNARGVDPESPAAKERLDPVAISVECDKAQSMTTVTAAARRGDRKVRIQVVARKKGTSWLVEYVLERNAAHCPVAVVIDPGGPAGFLIAKLQAAGVTVTTTTPRELGQASSDLVTAVKEDGLLHTRQPVLTSAALLVELRDLGESTVLDRDNEKGDVSPIVGAALALHGLTHGVDPTSVYESRGLTVL